MDSFNILSNDPGTNTVGISVINLDASTLKINWAQAYGVRADRFLRNRWSPHSDRQARLDCLYEYYVELLHAYRPVSVGCESNFLKIKTVSAYGPLVEAVQTLRYALRDYNQNMALQMVAPIEGKLAVGGKGNSKAETLAPYVEKTLGHVFRGDVSIRQLDEHALDALAINYALYLRLLARWTAPAIDLLA